MKQKATKIQDEIVIDSLDQAKALMDKLRMQMICALAKQPLTTKQLADRLEEKPTKLYHHMDVLEKHKLVRVVEQRVKSGIVEKYYQAVARTFRIDHRLLNPEQAASLKPILVDSLREMFDTTLADFERGYPTQQAVDADGGVSCSKLGLLTSQRVRLSPKHLNALHERLLDWVKDLDDADDPQAQVECLVTLVMLPFGEQVSALEVKPTARGRRKKTRSKKQKE